MADQERSERFQRLQEEVNQRVREAVAGLRERMEEHLRRLSDDARAALEGLTPELPESFLGAEELAPLTEEAARESGRRVLAELVAALADIDGARRQSDVLAALARGAGRFASRAAVFLVRPESARLWSAHGWSRELGDLELDYADGAWSPAGFGRGARSLDAGECAELCSRADEPLPDGGVLVPLVLRDRLAALVYADRRAADEPFQPEAVQALTWAAGLALESLPFRERETTPTLHGLGAAPPAAGPTLPLWGTDEETAEEAGEEAGEEAAEEGPAVEEGGWSDADGVPEVELQEAPGPEVAAPPVPPPDEGGEPWSFETVGEPGAVGDAATAAEEEPAADAGGAFEAAAEEAAFEPSDLAPAAEAEEAAGPEEEVPEEEVPEDELPEAAAVEVEAGAAEEWVAEEDAEDAASGVAAAGEPEPEEEGEEETTGVAPAWGAPPPPEPEHEQEAAEATWDGGVGPAPVAAPAEAEPAPPGGPFGVQPPAVPPPPPGGSEVHPPSDVEGPGRAFGDAGTVPADEESGRHEEARRLARLLVSEIRLYNEEEVEAGRRHGDIYERLKEDIDRSRQMYEERVDPGVRDATDYFYQELVRNLAAGDARALGI